MRTLILITLSLFISACSGTQPPVRAIDTGTSHVDTNRSITRSTIIPPVDQSTAPKTALVLGNSDYDLMPLDNPENDATDIGEKLKTMGFKVFLATNKSKVETKKLIRKFGKTLQQRGGVGVFFYAGHGMQIDGKNYLIPTGFRAQSAYEVSDEAVNLSLVTGAMEQAANPLNIIVLDACRDNPFPRKSRSGSRGLARVSEANGTLIAYSTSPGDVAADGDTRNSPYTQSLLKHMDTTGIPIEQVFKRVRRDVKNATQGKQTPWESSSITRDFYFKPGQPFQNVPPVYIPPVAVIAKPPVQAIAKPNTTSLISSKAKKLSIFTNPADSTISLLNSDVTYKRGVLLEPGSYQVSISKSGYITKKKWIVIDKNNVDIQITLAPSY